MIKFNAISTVRSVSPVIQVTDRFQKRELVLDESWEKDGKHYSNFVLVEFLGDKMSQLDSIYPGMRVNLEGMLTGREYEGRIYNSVRGISVSPYQTQQNYQAPPPPAQGYTASYPPPPAAPYTQPYAPAPIPSPAPQHTAPPDADDLPF